MKMKFFNLQRLGECAKSLLVAGIEIGLVCPFIFFACSFQVPLFLQLGFSSVDLELAGKRLYFLSLAFAALAYMAIVSGLFSRSGIGELMYFIALPSVVALGYSFALLHGIGTETDAIPIWFCIACVVGILSGIVYTPLRSVERKSDER